MMKHWINAFRLRTLPLSASSILMGGALAHPAYGLQGANKFSWGIFALTLLTTLLLQILSNLANDYGDSKKGADNDGRIGPARTVQLGVITPQAMLRAIVITALLAFFSGIALLFLAFGKQLTGTFLFFLLLGLAAIAAAIKYTVGKRAYGYSGLGDLFVFVFFGPVAVCGTFYLLTMQFSDFAVLPGITMGCFSMAVLHLNNMRDRENDAATGKITVAVKLGFENSKRYHYFLFLLAYTVFPVPLLLTAAGTGHYEMFIPILPVLLVHVIHLVRVKTITSPGQFDPELKKVALSAFLFALLFFGTLLFHA